MATVLGRSGLQLVHKIPSVSQLSAVLVASQGKLGNQSWTQNRSYYKTNVRSAAELVMGGVQVTEKEKSGSMPVAKYGGRHTVTMIPGGGIGPENMYFVKEVFRYAGVPVDFEEVNVDPDSETDDDLNYALTSIHRNGLAIKGNIETRSMNADVISRNVAIRNELDLYVSVINCKSFPGIPMRHNNVDVIVVRQNTEGEYAMMEHENVQGVVECLKVVTRQNIERVAKYGFGLARKLGRKKVTIVHKANIMKVSDGLLLDVCHKVAKEYPEIESNDMIIDNTCMQLVSRPDQFDMMIVTNLYGTIVTNLLCGLVGGAGLLSLRNYGPKYAIFEPGTRNTGTAIAGKNIANPIAMLNASVDLLDHLELTPHADMLRDAIYKTVNEDKIHTPDLHGTATSIEAVQNIIKYVQERTRKDTCVHPMPELRPPIPTDTTLAPVGFNPPLPERKD